MIGTKDPAFASANLSGVWDYMTNCCHCHCLTIYYCSIVVALRKEEEVYLFVFLTWHDYDTW